MSSPEENSSFKRVHVGGEARDQAAHRIAVVEGEIELLQVIHQLAAQVEHGLLSDPLHEVLFAEVAHQRTGDGQQIENEIWARPVQGSVARKRLSRGVRWGCPEGTR